MALKTFVKVNSITHLTDARYCAGMYVDLLGFALEPSSSKYVSPNLFQEITGWISGTGMCGEFTHSSGEQVLTALTNYIRLTAIQHEELAALIDLSGRGLELFWKVDVAQISGKANELGPILSKNSIQLLLTADQTELTEETENTIREFADYCSIILGFGIKATIADELLETLPLKGFALDGGEEIKPGLRDFEQMAELLELLEIED